jgi:TIR domain/Sel1 repeat
MGFPRFQLPYLGLGYSIIARAMASKIFISYRRDDSAGTAGRLHDRLAEAFGEENLFIDVDNMPAGADFVETLNKQVAICDVFLCTVGPSWLNAKDNDGQRRLDQPGDFVRVEIAEALKRNIPVIPVLVDGARVPKDRELPNDIAPLTRRQAVEVRNSHFRQDADELTRKIRGLLKRRRFALSRAVLGAIVGAVALLAFGSIGIYQAGMISVPWLRSGPTAPTTEPGKETVFSTSGSVAAVSPPNSLPPKQDASSAKQTSATDASRVDLVTDCDWLAAVSTDAQRPKSVPGVNFEQINIGSAVVACREAVNKYPDVARFSFQLGRILDANNDYLEARKQYEMAVKLGSAAALNNIGGLYERGSGVPQDYAEARRWYEKAAAAGDPAALNNIGRLYNDGSGVPQDYAEARRWYEKAAAGGNSAALNNIGSLYEDGSGVPQNYAEARRWYEKAAAGGIATAMRNLGDLYRDGRGVPKSVADARTWYQEAAAAGDATAKDSLARLPAK